MKSICFFHPSSDLYGSDKILLNLLQQFDNYHRTVILRNHGPLVEFVENMDNVRIIIEPRLPIIAKKYRTIRGMFNFCSNLLLFRGVCKKYDLFRCDIVYMNTIATSPILLFFGKKYKRISHIHEIVDNNRFIYRMILKYLLSRSDNVICVSDAVNRSLENVSKKNNYKICRIYNGVQLPPKGIPTTPLIFSNNKIKMALIGRIKPSMKGQYVLIDAIALLGNTELSQSHYYIIGSTVAGQEYMYDELVAYIKYKEVGSYVTIIPFVKDIELIYLSIDVVLVPSICEDSLPTTVLEAMSFGKAVIGTISGGIPEMIENGINGFLVEKNNSVQLAHSISQFILHRELCSSMGAMSKDIFEQKFTLKCFESNYQYFMLKKIKK